MSASDISVCISAYTSERWSDLQAAVASIASQTYPALETIVVVDHNPELLERVRAELPSVVATENSEPAGLSGARNSGVAIARGAVVAFLDDDAVAAPTWLALLAEGYRQPHVAGVGGSIVPAWRAGRPGWFPAEFDWVVGCTYLGMPERPASTRNLIGCNMSFRRELLLTVGGFRSGIGRIGTLPVGCEETELCIRTLQRFPTSMFLYDPRAQVRHSVPRGRATWRYFRSRCYAEGLSKALVTRLVGAGHGLETERAYTMRTLPSGVIRGMADVVLRRDPTGPARALAILGGLAVTTCGFATGRARAALARPRGGVERLPQLGVVVQPGDVPS